jgi:hypothetical protein
MDIKEIFEAVITLQEYGYKINLIEKDEYENYFLTFALADVCSGLAFGGCEYTISLTPTPKYVDKRIIRTDVDITQKVSTIEEAINFIVDDIKRFNEELKEEERKEALAKLTKREKELLGLYL